MKRLYQCVFLLAFISIALNTYAQKKISYGIGLDVFQTKLNNVDREHYTGYGHSVPGFKQNDRLGFGLNGIIKIPIHKGLGIETGVGLTRYQSQFHFEYFHTFFLREMDTELNIGLNYLKLPFNLYYDIKVSETSSIIISGGLNLKLLLWANDNFTEIIFEEIGLPSAYKRYESLIYAYSGSLSYRYTSKNKKSFEIAAFIGADLNKAVNRNPSRLFGFYGNLSPASYSHYGISLKYFFTNQ